MKMKPLCSRRHFLFTSSFALGAHGLADLLRADGLLAGSARAGEGDGSGRKTVKPDLEPRTYDLLPKSPHFAPRARAMISMFMIGGPSQIDLFDPKPELVRNDGKTFTGDIKYDNAAEASSKILGPAWKFRPRGQCGMEISDLMPHLGSIADEITLIRSMRTAVNNHIPSMYALNTGRERPGRPSFGSWLLYGLGSETREMPAYVALTHPWGLPLVGGENWTNGWLPAIYQGTPARPKEPRVLNLEPPPHLRGEPRDAQLDLLRRFNAEHLAERPGENELAARVANYELAARMQLAAKEAFDISLETEETREFYGVNDPVTRDYGTRCLIARRLVERGVRYVQILNNGQSWDHHGAILSELPKRCAEIDRPAAALVLDLKRRGLLDGTIVHWGGEMGRLPVIQNDTGREKIGRDHNTYGFSQWVAGGGFKAGYVHGATDEFSHHAVEGVVTHLDWIATLMHLFGLDHERLVYKRDNRELVITDNQGGSVVKELLA